MTLESPQLRARLPRAKFGGSALSTSNGRKRKKATATLPATVEKVIKPHPGSSEPEKAQISVGGTDELYRELRIPNELEDGDGNHVKLREGTEVEVTIESDEASQPPSR